MSILLKLFIRDPLQRVLLQYPHLAVGITRGDIKALGIFNKEKFNKNPYIGKSIMKRCDAPIMLFFDAEIYSSMDNVKRMLGDYFHFPMKKYHWKTLFEIQEHNRYEKNHKNLEYWHSQYDIYFFI